MLFGRRIGFSGTPSDILPQELGGCQYERGSDGKVVHYLTSPSVVRFVKIQPNWTVHTLLNYIATASPAFNALIDTGALITGMSNLAVAEYLLDHGLENMKGVVFLDELDRQMMLLRKGKKVVALAESGVPLNERFAFYDQVHTTGMDIKHTVDACAALTLGKDMVFRDYAQGAFRMRGIGKGQTICLLIVPEIEERIRSQVSIGAGVGISVSAPNATPSDLTIGEYKQKLKDILSWLVINSMRVDGIQFSLLCEQSVSNIWRKRIFMALRSNFRDMESDRSSPEMDKWLSVYRQRLDFQIETSVPVTETYSSKISKLIASHKSYLQEESDVKTAKIILSLIREEERVTEEIKRTAKTQLNVDIFDGNDVAAGTHCYSPTYSLT